MPSTYPKPWIATGCGSYRQLDKDHWEMTWRPEGMKGPKPRRRVRWREEEILVFLARQAGNKSRRSVGEIEEAGWSEALAYFEKRQRSRRRKEPYIKATIDLLEDLRDHCGQPLSLVRAQDVERWMNERADQLQEDERPGWARTMNKQRAMIGHFFNLLYHKGQMRINPVLGADTYEQTKKKPRRLEPEEYGKVWEVSEPPIRDLLTWFLLTGTRFSETANAKRKDISDGIWYIPERKGRDDHELPMPTLLNEIVLRQPPHVDQRIFHKYTAPAAGSKAENERNRAKLKVGAPIDPFWFRRVLTRRCEIAGVPKFTCHDMRRAGARWARLAGKNMSWIQAFLGHSKMQTTELYTGNDLLSGAKTVQSLLEKMHFKAIQSVK